MQLAYLEADRGEGLMTLPCSRPGTGRRTRNLKGRFGSSDHGSEWLLLTLLTDSLGHVVRAYQRSVDGNSMVDDFDVGLTAFTLEQRIITVDQVLTQVLTRSSPWASPNFS
jgi:hypothetical protein